MKIKFLIPIIILFFISIVAIDAQSKVEVSSKEVNTMLSKNKKLILIDVRTAEEFNAGHIKGSINIDVHQPDAFDQINKLDRNASYIVYCRTKNRSGVIANHMIQNNFKTVYQMIDGITGWNQNKQPVEK